MLQCASGLGDELLRWTQSLVQFFFKGDSTAKYIYIQRFGVQAFNFFHVGVEVFSLLVQLTIGETSDLIEATVASRLREFSSWRWSRSRSSRTWAGRSSGEGDRDLVIGAMVSYQLANL